MPATGQLAPYTPAGARKRRPVPRWQPAPPGAALEGCGGIVVHAYNPLDPSQRMAFRSRPGLTLDQLKPVTTLPTVCQLNGEYVLAEDWPYIELEVDDIAVFLTLPKGGGGGSFQAVLGIILIIVGVIVPGAQALIAVGAALLLSGLLPTPSFAPLVNNQGESPSPTYNVQLQGNSARLGQAMPVPYGRHFLTPDFAAPPYNIFTEDDDQLYHAVLCIGVMDKFTLEAITIDDTVLDHFIGVSTQLIGPQYGAATLTLVNPAVVNAPEVAGQEMFQGMVIGPFAACGPGLSAVKIGIDIVWPKGLYYANNDGELDPKSTQWMFEARKLTANGAAAGVWFLLGVEELELAQNSPVRRSYEYTVPAGRYEVRGQRLDARDNNARAGHDMTWAGLRTYINTATPLEPNANFLAIRMQANAQLSGLSQRRIGVIIRRWLPTWHPDTGWSDPVETRSIAWALADVLRNPVYGPTVPDNRIDLQTLYELDLEWAARGDTFNGVFDKRITVWAALTTIARCGRARPVMRGSVFTFVRDNEQTLPVAMFNTRNIKRGSFQIDYETITEDTPDGLELEFFDETTWSSNYVKLPMPGVIGDPVSPARASMQGVTVLKQAQRECAYMVADAGYRRSRISFRTEMEGFLPALGDLIAVAHDVAGWGSGGEITSFNGSSAECSEQLDWSVGANYAVLADDQGDVHGPYLVAQGSTPNSMRFMDSVPSGLIYTGTERERTRYAMGPASAYAKLCKVTGLVPSSDDTVQIRAVVEDGRVHSADLPYAGSGGGGSSGDGRVARYAPPGIPTYDAASDAQRDAYGFFSDPDRTVGSTDDEGYVYSA